AEARVREPARFPGRGTLADAPVPRSASTFPSTAVGHRILPTDGAESRAIAMNSEQGAQWWNRSDRTHTTCRAVAEVGGCMETDARSLPVRRCFPRSV